MAGHGGGGITLAHADSHAGCSPRGPVADLARAERDPAWPLILAQIAGSRPEPQACDTVLAAAAGALAAAQVLLFIDTGHPGEAVTNGTLELAVPDWQWRRRTWWPEPRCTCGASTRGMADN